ncbi:MAG: hypothetical protein IKX31_12050 [Muribaculaceae bacterium]|nr:hypothetical protein [Muribaculaceae bacterium]
MLETRKLLLEKYVKYIEKLAKERSCEIFTNGGIEYASHLMAVLFRNTKSEARLFCHGFRPDLICKQPYWDALKDYLKDDKKILHVLVESEDFLNDEPMELLRRTKSNRGDDTIDFRLIGQKDCQKIFNVLNWADCNFAVFDHDKFRFEYDPEGFKAFGSFNHEKNCEILVNLFDEAFNNALLLN